MVFSSNIFLFFYLPTVLALYCLVPGRFRNLVLLLVSLLFYGWGEPAYLAIMVFVILLNYACGAVIARRRREGRSAKAALACSIALNLLVLGYFKYAAFLLDTLRPIPGLGWLPRPEIALPIGISFYIFQSMSYTIDLSRGDAQEAKSLLRFGTYVSMFPQLIAGPIVRYRDVARQIDERSTSLRDFSAGVCLFIIGLAKKLLLANQVGALWEALIPLEGTLSAWVGLLAYSLQIYFDFSGYADMALGLGRMLGFHFLKNFNYPYMATSVTDFWRRWHISLSTWFREYVYIPLGGNRVGKGRLALNLFVVWSLTGLWHGASWNFVIWGLYYGILIAAEHLFLDKLLARCPGVVRRLATLTLVALGWGIFYFVDFGQGLVFFRRLLSWTPGTVHERTLCLSYLPVLLAAMLGSTPLLRRLWGRISPKPWADAALLPALSLLFIFCVAALATQSYNPFIYFRF